MPDRAAAAARRAGFVLVILAATSARAGAAPDAELWERWLSNNPDSAVTIDHTEWERLLERYLRSGSDGVNRFDYAAVAPHDRATLTAYLDMLSAAPVSRRARREQLVFWINLYNALTVDVVLRHYPVDTIKDIDISPGLFADGPWGLKLFTVEGEAVSLDDIEHRILRPIWRDPRVHYALSCAAVGCPQLNAEAFTGENGERLLEESARAFVNHPRGVEVSARGIELSSIYRWYRDDFGDDTAAVLEHLRGYAEPALAEVLAASPRVLGYHYDWRLNDIE
jgi:hypothetical protein